MTRPEAFRVDDVITNGPIAGKVIEVMSGADPRWRTPGVMLSPISTDQTIVASLGAASFVPDHLLTGWYLVPFDWSTVINGRAEERYSWADDRHTMLTREVRAIRKVECPNCGHEL